jgi:hypothetical protein
MGTSFFKHNAPPQFGGGNPSIEARALSAPSYAARGSAIGAQKDVGAAQGINMAAYKGPLKRSAAYAPGPKKT